jgi:hypothetical protein
MVWCLVKHRDFTFTFTFTDTVKIKVQEEWEISHGRLVIVWHWAEISELHQMSRAVRKSVTMTHFRTLPELARTAWGYWLFGVCLREWKLRSKVHLLERSSFRFCITRWPSYPFTSHKNLSLQRRQKAQICHRIEVLFVPCFVKSRGKKSRDAGEDYITRSFRTCKLHQILLGWLNHWWWNERDM